MTRIGIRTTRIRCRTSRWKNSGKYVLLKKQSRSLLSFTVLLKITVAAQEAEIEALYRFLEIAK